MRVPDPARMSYVLYRLYATLTGYNMYLTMYFFLQVVITRVILGLVRFITI